MFHANGTILNGYFHKNTALKFAQIDLNFGTLVVEDCTFIENHCDSGCGLHIIQTTARVTRCSFINNYALTDGGAISAQASLILFEDSTMTDNRCGGAGGAIALVFRAAFDAYDCYFARNSAATRGGVSFLIGTRQPIRLFNCTVEDNTADEQGGAFYLWNTRIVIDRKTTIRRNVAPIGGGILILGSSGSVTMYNQSLGNNAVLARVVTNMANTEADISASGVVGEWWGICDRPNYYTVMLPDGRIACPLGPCDVDDNDYYADETMNTGGCGQMLTQGERQSKNMFPSSRGEAYLAACDVGYVQFDNPSECAAVPAGSVLPRDAQGNLLRQAVECAVGQYSFHPGYGHADHYSVACQQCPANALCLGGSRPPTCDKGSFHPRSDKLTWRSAVDSCQLCPADVTCEGASARGIGWSSIGGVLTVLPGYWVAPAAALCGVDAACLKTRVYECSTFGCMGNVSAAHNESSFSLPRPPPPPMIPSPVAPPLPPQYCTDEGVECEIFVNNFNQGDWNTQPSVSSQKHNCRRAAQEMKSALENLNNFWAPPGGYTQFVSVKDICPSTCCQIAVWADKCRYQQCAAPPPAAPPAKQCVDENVPFLKIHPVNSGCSSYINMAPNDAAKAQFCTAPAGALVDMYRSVEWQPPAGYISTDLVADFCGITCSGFDVYGAGCINPNTLMPPPPPPMPPPPLCPDFCVERLCGWWYCDEAYSGGNGGTEILPMTGACCNCPQCWGNTNHAYDTHSDWTVQQLRPVADGGLQQLPQGSNGSFAHTGWWTEFMDGYILQTAWEQNRSKMTRSWAVLRRF